MPPLQILSGSPYSSFVSHPSLEKGTCLRRSTVWVWGEHEAGYSLQSRRAQKMYGLSIFNYSKGRYYMCNTCTHTQYTSQCTSQRRFDMYCSFVVFHLFTLLSSLCAKKDYTVLCALFHACFTPCGGRIMTDRTCIRFSCRVIHRKSSQTLISLPLSFSRSLSCSLHPSLPPPHICICTH